MSSDRKIRQARANGAKSHGPKTPEGKQASSQNARTHGLNSQFVVLDGESEDEFNRHWREFIDEHQPGTPTEQELVHRLAVASWRLHRCYAREASLTKLMMIDQRDHLDNYYNGLTPADRSAHAFRILADTGRALELLNRYETRDRRAFDQALKTLLQLKSARNPKQPPAPQPTTHHLPPAAVFPNEPTQPVPETPALQPTGCCFRRSSRTAQQSVDGNRRRGRRPGSAIALTRAQAILLANRSQGTHRRPVPAADLAA